MLKQLKTLCDHYGVNGSLYVFRPEKNKKEMLSHWLVENALKTGRLKKGQAVAEITAGNMGVALARECEQIGSELYLVPIGTFTDSVERKLNAFSNVHIVSADEPRIFRCLSSTLERVIAEKNAFSFRQFSSSSQLQFFQQLLNEQVDFLPVDCVMDKIGTGATLQSLIEKFTVNGKAPEAFYATNGNYKIDTSYFKFFDEMPKQIFPLNEKEYLENFESVLFQTESLTDLPYAKLTLFCAVEWLKQNPNKTVFVFIGD